MLRRFKFIFLIFGFIACGITNAFSATDELQGDGSMSVIKYHISEELRSRLNFRLPVIIENGNYIERIKIYLKNPEDPDDKGNPDLSFSERIGSTENMWSLLCMSADRGDDELVSLLRQCGASDNYQDSYGITPLHRAAFRGHTTSVQILLQPIGTDRRKANALCTDRFGFTPGDYLRIALYGCKIHGRHEIKGLLDSAEEAERIDLKRKSERIGSFIEAFIRDCDGILASEQLLNVGMIARSSNPMSFSNIISIFGNIVPVPGAGTISTVLGGVASAVEERIAAQKTAAFLDCSANISDDMKREFKKLACFLADLYEEPIQKLTPMGAGQLGAYGAKRVAKYIRSLKSPRDVRDVGFIKQIEKYFREIEVRPIRDGMLNLGEVLDGSTWRAREVLNGTVPNSKISAKESAGMGAEPIKSALGFLMSDRRSDTRDETLDPEEAARLEILLHEDSEERAPGVQALDPSSFGVRAKTTGERISTEAEYKPQDQFSSDERSSTVSRLIQGEIGDDAEVDIGGNAQQTFNQSFSSHIDSVPRGIEIRQGNIGGRVKVRVKGNFTQIFS